MSLAQHAGRKATGQGSTHEQLKSTAWAFPGYSELHRAYCTRAKALFIPFAGTADSVAASHFEEQDSNALGKPLLGKS